MNRSMIAISFDALAALLVPVAVARGATASARHRCVPASTATGGGEAGVVARSPTTSSARPGDAYGLLGGGGVACPPR